ncbi:MAG: MMPL family transporter [Acidobacteriota bacterium]
MTCQVSEKAQAGKGGRSGRLLGAAGVGSVCSHLRGKVVDEVGGEPPRGADGELCIAGPSVMSGYWNATSQWSHSPRSSGTSSSAWPSTAASPSSYLVTVEDASRFLPAGFLDASIRKMGDGRYMAAVSVYASDPDASDVLPDETLDALQRTCGPFFVFSFSRLNRDVQSQVASDARRSLQLTVAGIVLIVLLCFRSVPISLAVLTPTAFSIIITFGLLILLHHPFSLMAVASLPLIIGIGIDNGIHMANRYLEGGGKDIIAVVRATGAALFLSNLTTLVGFGALMLSDFYPLAELGLVTTTGMALTMSASMLFLPAAILLLERRRAARSRRQA